MTRSYLLIGGVADGWQRDVDVNQRYTHVASAKRLSHESRSDIVSEAEMMKPTQHFKESTYRRETLRMETGVYEFFVENNLSLDDAIALLLKNYRPDAVSKS